MITFRLHARKENHNNIILNFIKPLINEFLNLKAINSFLFRRYIHVDSPYIKIHLINPKSEFNFEENIKLKWNLFLEKEKSSFNLEEIEETTVFLKYPYGYFKFSHETDLDQTKNHLFYTISKTTFSILRYREEVKEENEDEININTMIVFIYALGGYSKDKMIQISQSLIHSLNFLKEDESILDNLVFTIIKENEKFFKNSISKIYEELSSYYVPPYNSVLSEWKYSFSNFSQESFGELDNKEGLFSIFKNQINLTDSEAYCILNIITEIFSKINNPKNENNSNILVGKSQR